MNNNIRYKPCPFCGSKDIRLTWDGGWLQCHVVECSNCHAQVYADGMQDAIDLWNTRVST